MNQYCLTFEALSTITAIPDSQKIFGYLCNYFLNVKGKEVFEDYIQSFSNTPLLVHSSMFIAETLPMIKESLFSSEYINKEIVKAKPEEQISYLQRMKQYKKLSSMSKDIYQKYIETDALDLLRNDVISNQTIKVENQILMLSTEDLRVNVQRNMNTHVRKTGFYFSEENPNELYYNEDLYFDQETQFQLFVKTELSKEEVEEIFSYTQYFGLGIKHSVGKNSFRLTKIEDCKYKSSSKRKLLLSKTGYDEAFEVDHSSYVVLSRMFKTSNSYLDNHLVGQISFFGEGSYMKVNQEKEWYGEIIEETIDDSPIYHYAIGYVF